MISLNMPATHAHFGSPKVVLGKRRSLYRMAARFLNPTIDSKVVHRESVIDNPLTRNAIMRALVGDATLDLGLLRPLSTVADARFRPRLGRSIVPVVSSTSPQTLLSGVESALEEKVRGHFCSSKLLTSHHGTELKLALENLVKGSTLAYAVSPELADDLFPHISLIGILNRGPMGTRHVESASLREYPGLVLFSTPQTVSEAAEALVHEAAHQKFFDLAITASILHRDSRKSGDFLVPWGRGAKWPLDQVFAACHAYACLAQMYHNWKIHNSSHPLHEGSLLPVAAERTKILSEWLLAHDNCLGEDGVSLIELILGRGIRQRRPPATTLSFPIGGSCTVDSSLVFRRYGTWGCVLVGRPSKPPEFFWLDEECALILKHVKRGGLDSAILSLASLRGLRASEASRAVHARLSELAEKSLVSVTGGS
jgi:hypothetical protein